MNSPLSITIPSLAEAAQFSPEQVVELARLGHQRAEQLAQQVSQMQAQLDWFKRQIFGQKSERRLFDADGRQLSLGEVVTAETLAGATRQVAAHRCRAKPAQAGDAGAESLPFFDASRVPIETIELPAETGDLGPDAYEIVSHKESYRLAQRPGSYVVLKYVRPVIKVRESGKLLTPPAPQGVLEGSRADVSFLAGLLIDKFAYHLPLYRQHQRLIDAGFTVSRPWLTQLVTQAAALLEPIYQAQLASIAASRVKSMDETPIKAGRAGAGKLKSSYFWPIYGEANELCFPWCESREARHVLTLLGEQPGTNAVLLTDGYTAYQRYAEKTGITHAQCWAHTRRKFFEARDIEPVADKGLALIGALYQVEAEIREQGLSGAEKRALRQQRSAALVTDFFHWVNQVFERHGLLPSSKLTKALAYARERRQGLSVFLDDPEVPIDTNHLERALRPIPMGRKNWLFCWTELGAKQVGILQSLIATCRLHDINPYDYLVDVLQRVGQHPAARVAELTPRLWKIHFAANPLRSALDRGASYS